MWLMNEEVNLSVELEEMRIKSQALATNPATSGEYLKQLYAQDEQEEEGEWIEITDPSQLEDFLNQYS
jgi:hypothetical protein